MSKTALQRILAVLAGLVVLYGVVRLATGGGSDVRPGAQELAAALEGLDEGTLQVVRMIGPDDEIEVSRAPDGWRVNGFQPDSAALARMFATLTTTEVGSMVAANPANHERLGVAGHEAWTLEFGLGGDEVRSVILGSVGSVFQTVFARLPDADEVYTLHGDMRGTFTRTLVDWRYKVITRVDTAAVHTVVVERDGESVTLERADSTWTLADSGDNANAADVNAAVGELRDLRATAFADEGTVLPEEDNRRLVVLGADGETLAALTLAPEGSDYLLRMDGEETIYRVPSFRAGRIVPEVDNLRGDDGG